MNTMSKNQALGMVVGAAAGLMLTVCAGMAVKSLAAPKSPVKKKVSNAFESMGEIFESLAKFTS